MLSDENEEGGITGLEVTNVEIEASHDSSSPTITGCEKQLEYNKDMNGTIDKPQYRANLMRQRAQGIISRW